MKSGVAERGTKGFDETKQVAYDKSGNKYITRKWNLKQMDEQKTESGQGVQKQNHNFSGLQTFYKVVTVTMDYAITLYLILLVGVMPFYFTQGYGYVATDKARFFGWVSMNFGRILAVLLMLSAMLAFVMYCTGRRGNRASRISALDVLVGLYGVSLMLSYLCSDYRDVALWGANGWYMGLIPQLILVGVYFALSFLWMPKKGVFALILVSSEIVFALGLLNRFGIYPFEMEWKSYGYISTIGNINWYCGYAVITFFAGVGLFWQKGCQRWWCSLLLLLYVYLGFASLVVQGSLSGIVTIGGMLVVLFCLSARDRRLMQRFWTIALLFSLACLSIMGIRITYPDAMTYTDEAINMLTVGKLPIVMTVVSFALWLAVAAICEMDVLRTRRMPEKLFKYATVTIATLVSCGVLAILLAMIVNTLAPGSIGAWSEYPALTFSPAWGSGRGATWEAGLKCFSQQEFLHKLFGVGPDAMSAYLHQDADEALLLMTKQTFGELILTNAHNEGLTILVNLGLLGLAAFWGLSFVALRQFLQARGQQVMVAACACGMLAYTINNMFSFQQTMNVTMFFILLGLGRCCQRVEETTTVGNEQWE